MTILSKAICKICILPISAILFAVSCSDNETHYGSTATTTSLIPNVTTSQSSNYSITTNSVSTNTLPEGFYSFHGTSVDELNELSLRSDCIGIVFDSNLELVVDKTIVIRGNQTISGNGSKIKRDLSFDGKMISLYENVEFCDFSIDGSNISNGEWDKTIDLATSSNCNVHDCSFINSNETIIAYGENVLIENCIIENANGNGIHLSDCKNSIIRNNVVKNSNLSESYTNGQCGIYICQDVYNVLIKNNKVDNAKNGIGRLDSIKDQDITIKENKIMNCREYGIHGIYHYSAEDESSKNILIMDNNIINSKYVAFRNNTDNAIKSDMSLTFSNNTLVNTHLSISSNKNSKILNNKLDGCHIELNLVDGIEISGNTIDGDEFGIYAQRTKNANIHNNIVKSNKYGICLKTESSNNNISNNDITIDSNLESGVEGIYAGPSSEINLNEIRINIGTGIICNDDSSIISNTIIGTQEGVIAIRVYGGSHNIAVQNNQTNLNCEYILSNGDNCNYDNNIRAEEI